MIFCFFFFNDTATTEIYTLSLHDALPIYTGRDPIPLMNDCLKEMKINSNSELLWASPRELLNIIQADNIGCHIITVTKDIINKLELINFDLEEYSLDTVKTFYKDASQANFKI